MSSVPGSQSKIAAHKAAQQRRTPKRGREVALHSSLAFWRATRRIAFDFPDGIMSAVEICHLFISPGHNFVGHHGREADTYPIIETSEMQCVAGRGIRGDRYFDFKCDYKGQITFFSLEVFDELCSALQIYPRSPSLARRNVITRGVDLNNWIGQEFEVQGIRFFGTEECRPCYWMDGAFALGAQEFLKGRGGLRAKILCDGLLRSVLFEGETVPCIAATSPLPRERVG